MSTAPRFFHASLGGSAGPRPWPGERGPRPGLPDTWHLQQKKCFLHPCHAFLYSNGTMTDLGTLGGINSKGLAINLSGEVVGLADTNTGGSSFLWNGTTMTARWSR